MAGRPVDAGRGTTINIKSVEGAKVIREPSVPTEVYVASFAINLLALALPLSIMQVYDRVIPNRSMATLAFLFLGLALALVVDFVLKTTRSALLSWHAMHFVRNVENEAVARLLRAPDGTIEGEPVAVHANRYAAAAALGDYHCGQARLVSIDLPFVGIALIVMTIIGGVMVLVPAGLFFIFAALAVGRARLQYGHHRHAREEFRRQFLHRRQNLGRQRRRRGTRDTIDGGSDDRGQRRGREDPVRGRVLHGQRRQRECDHQATV